MSDENTEIQSPTTGGSETAAPVATTTTETPASAPSIWDTMDKTASDIASREPVRGADGKFQPKLAAEGANGVQVPGSPQAAPPDPQPEVIEAPQSLPADVKGKWSTLPLDVQKAWAAREGEMHKKFTADGERIRSLSAIEEVASTIQDRLKQVNAPAAEYFRRLAEADKLLASDGVRGLQQIAQMYGIDLRSAFQPGAQPDPNSALARELTQLRSQNEALSKQVEGIQQESEATKLRDAEERIKAVRKDMPHYDEVEPLMVKLYEPGMDLKALYDKAVRAHDDVYAKVQAEAKTAADKKAAEEAKARADKDSRFAPLARKPGSTPTAPIKGKNIWETMDRVASEVRAR